MTIDEIKRLPLDEKIRLMEALWDDLRERFERAEIPESVKRLLDERRERMRSGKAQVLDWDSVKGTLGRA
jgi:putative addiction module component (TIGR02574 family)